MVAQFVQPGYSFAVTVIVAAAALPREAWRNPSDAPAVKPGTECNP